MTYRNIFNTELHKLVTNYMGDLAEDVTLTRQNYTGDYNPVTGAIVNNDTTEIVRGLFGKFTREQDNIKDIAPEDVKCTLSQTQVTVPPQNNDTITRGGIKYEIISVQSVAFNSLWVLQLRQA